MKIKQAPNRKPPVDISSMFLDFAQQYDNVYVVQIQNDTFIYRALGRSEYREIMDDERFSNWNKEELLCQQCLLYPNPEEYDWENCDAGIPTELCAHILDNSYLLDMNKRKKLLDYYRSEMYDMDNQMTCLINEAFPMLDIEEIESWDVEKTTKYYSRAEWKLHTLRGMPYVDTTTGGNYEDAEDEDYEEETREENSNRKMDSTKTLRGGSRKEKLTPDKMKSKTKDKQKEEYLKFLQAHPDFAQACRGQMDNAIIHGMEGLAQDGVDTTPPALRVGR